MKSILLVCLMVLFCNSIQAQNTIRGKITDQKNSPLAGATIYLSEMSKGTISGDDGAYELKKLPNGKIKIQYSYLGYSSKIETVILEDRDLEINIALHATAIETEGIVVTGGYNSTQHENAVKIDILKLEVRELKQTPNFMESLTKIPGVDMISKGSGVSKPVIRGLSMNDILVLNNGVRFENYQYSSHHPLGIDEFGIEDVEVIKGPASLLYGSDAIGGVINFIREKPAPINSISGDYNLKLFSNTLGITNNLGIKGASKNFFGGIRAGMKSNADFLQGGGVYAPNSRFNEYSVKTNAGFTGKTGTFKLFYDYSKQNLGLVEDEAIESINARGRECGIFYQQLNTHLLSSQNKLYINNLKLEINSAYQNTELIHFGEADVYEIQMRLGTLTYETKIHLPSDKNSEYIVGFQGMNQQNTNLNNRETKLLPDAVSNNYSAFGLLQKTLFNKFKLQTGMRYDYKTIATETTGIVGLPGYRSAIEKSYGSFSGSLGLTYNITEQLFLRGNIAAAYRTPNLAELTSNGPHETRYELGDNSLVPENSAELDISMHYHSDNLTFDLAGFRNMIRNYIFIAPTGDTSATGMSIYKYMQRNSNLFGGEAGIHFHPRSIQWLHLESTFASVIGKQNNGEYLPFIPAHKLNCNIKVEKKKLSFLGNAFLSLNSETAFDQNKPAPDETATEGYSIFDISVGGDLKFKNQQATLAFGVTNIFDAKYIDHLSTLKEVNLNNPGRSITFTMRIPFGFRLQADSEESMKQATWH